MLVCRQATSAWATLSLDHQAQRRIEVFTTWVLMAISRAVDEVQFLPQMSFGGECHSREYYQLEKRCAHGYLVPMLNRGMRRTDVFFRPPLWAKRFGNYLVSTANHWGTGFAR